MSNRKKFIERILRKIAAIFANFCAAKYPTIFFPHVRFSG